MEKKRLSILEANYLYMITAILLVTVGAFFQARDIYSGIFITEYIILFLPMVLFVFFRKYNFKEIFKLNKISFKEMILTILIVIFSYPIALFFNYMMMIVISMFGELKQSQLPVPENKIMFLKSLFLFAITPGICEEVMFRGLIQSAYERTGAKKAIVITGILFGIFHFNILNFLGPVFLGILFGYMVYKTNSLYTSIIAHTVNNTIAVILLTIVGSQNIEPLAISSAKQTEMILSGFISLGVLSIFLSIVVYFLLKKLSKVSKKRIGYNNGSEKIFRGKIGILQKTLQIIPIILVCFIFIFSVVGYFQNITK